ncbi:armadillo repeat-containing kinesin-like protein 1 [Tanacetum coccineum]
MDKLDEVFTEVASQMRVYEAVAKPVVEGVLNGYNGTNMAYGQTGTRKTFTLRKLGKDDASERGIMVRALEDIISGASQAYDSVEISYLQEDSEDESRRKKRRREEKKQEKHERREERQHERREKRHACDSDDKRHEKDKDGAAPLVVFTKFTWDDDVVFKNQARGEAKALKHFINDTISSDFHRNFLQEYMKHDIDYAVGRLSRHISSPGKEHWDAVNRVFKYLKQTMDYGLEYIGDPLVSQGYTNAS